MATTDKNVSPEERLLNVIRGKDGKESKSPQGGQAASATVDEEAPPLDEAPPSSTKESAPAAAPVKAAAPLPPDPGTPAPTLRMANPAASASAGDAQSSAPRSRGPLGDEKLKAALSRKVSERTKGDDRLGVGSVPRGVGGAAGAIARAAAQDSSAPAPSRSAPVATTSETTRFIAKKIQGDTAPGVRYVSMGFAALIVLVVMLSAYEIVAAINLDPVPTPPGDEAVATGEEPRNMLDYEAQYQLAKLLDGLKHKPLFGQLNVLPDTPGGGPVTKPQWVDDLEKNFIVVGRLGDPANGGELILSDKRDKKQYFIGLKSGVGIGDVTIYLKSLEGSHRAIFHDGQTQYTAGLNW